MRTQIKTVIREKRDGRPKKVSKPKKSKPVKDTPPPSERRRSGRAHKVSVYTEREDEEDEEEMLEGVADWEYPENDSEGGEASSGDDESELSDAPPEEDEDDDSNKASDNDEPPEPEADKPELRFNGRNAAPALKSRGASKPAVKASVLAEVKRPTRSTRSRRGKGTDDMEIDADE